MRLFPAGKLFFGRGVAVAAITALMALISGRAQNPTIPNPDQAQRSKAVPAQNAGSGETAAPEQSPKPTGTVLFHRSLDSSGNPASTTGAQEKAKTVEAPVVSDAERSAVSVTGLNLDVRVNSEAQQIAVRGLVTVRNAGNYPLTRIPLQISSSLNWERIRVDGHDVRFPVAKVDSDSDHTLQLHEAVAQLTEPLAAGASADVLALATPGSMAAAVAAESAPTSSLPATRLRRPSTHVMPRDLVFPADTPSLALFT